MHLFALSQGRTPHIDSTGASSETTRTPVLENEVAVGVKTTLSNTVLRRSALKTHAGFSSGAVTRSRILHFIQD